jgi:subtilisin family serine protease
MTDLSRPAWSEAFATDARVALLRTRPFGTMDRRLAFGETRGRGVTIAIIDSGVEPGHPAVGGRLVRSLRVEIDAAGPRVVDDPDPVDLVGHGTACAGVIHDIAPAAELVSIRVLGADNRAAGPAFAAALSWAIGEGFGVVNLSLSSRSEAMAARLHELADEAYFANSLLVAAANNVAAVLPSLFAAVGGRARYRGPRRLVLQPGPAGRVRRPRPRRRRGLARRHTNPGDGQLVCGPASGRSSGPDPLQAPGGQPVRGQASWRRRTTLDTTPSGSSGRCRVGRRGPRRQPGGASGFVSSVDDLATGSGSASEVGRRGLRSHGLDIAPIG